MPHAKNGFEAYENNPPFIDSANVHHNETVAGERLKTNRCGTAFGFRGLPERTIQKRRPSSSPRAGDSQ
ncbi:MAG: hypothetical protein JW888_11360 [Pirellulales bacterium]|nr:hypothetical protein [Pirellulales bacterium]